MGSGEGKPRVRAPGQCSTGRVNRGDGGPSVPAVLVILDRRVDGEWWSVLSVVGHEQELEYLSLDIQGASVEIGVDRFGAAWIEVRVGYARSSTIEEFRSEDPIRLELGFSPSGPGHLLILFRDEGGSVFLAHGFALPAGDLAAG